MLTAEVECKFWWIGLEWQGKWIASGWGRISRQDARPSVCHVFIVKANGLKLQSHWLLQLGYSGSVWESQAKWTRPSRKRPQIRRSERIIADFRPSASSVRISCIIVLFLYSLLHRDFYRSWWYIWCHALIHSQFVHLGRGIRMRQGSLSVLNTISSISFFQSTPCGGPERCCPTAMAMDSLLNRLRVLFITIEKCVLLEFWKEKSYHRISYVVYDFIVKICFTCWFLLYAYVSLAVALWIFFFSTN